MKEIVVISGKGGTGKTSVVSALADLGPKKVLADCDVDAADLHLILEPEKEKTHEFWSGELASIDPDLCTECSECIAHCRFGAISADFKIIKEHCEGCALCFHVCPVQAISMQPRLCGEWYESRTRFGPLIHASLGIGEENSGKLVTQVRQASHEKAKEKGLEMVLVDGSPGIGCPVIASLTNANLVLLVAEPTVSAVGDLRRVYELTHHFELQAVALINKSDINTELVEEIEDFCKDKNIPVLGKLPYDLRFTKAQINCQSIVEYDPQGLGKIMQKIWTSLESYL